LQCRAGTPAPELPVWRMTGATERALARRARALAAMLATAGIPAEVIATRSTVGGGSLPEETQPSRGVATGKGSAAEVLRALRPADPPVIARIIDGRAVLDVRSVLPEDDERLGRAVIAALS